MISNKKQLLTSDNDVRAGFQRLHERLGTHLRHDCGGSSCLLHRKVRSCTAGMDHTSLDSVDDELTIDVCVNCRDREGVAFLGRDLLHKLDEEIDVDVGAVAAR